MDKELQRDVRRPYYGNPDQFARELDEAAGHWALVHNDRIPWDSPASRAHPQTSYARASLLHQPTPVEVTSINPLEREAAFQRIVRATKRRLLGAPNNSERQITARYTQEQANGLLGYDNSDMQP